MHIIRTNKTPFIQSHASKAVYISSISISVLAIFLPYTILGEAIGLVPMNLTYILTFMVAIPLLYCIVAQIIKKCYIKRYKEWL